MEDIKKKTMKELEHEYKNFKLIDMYSDYGDITGIQIIRRFIQHCNKHFGTLNESIREFIRLYTDLTEIMDEFTAFFEAWEEMDEANENFILEVRQVLEDWIDDPRLKDLIDERLLQGKLDKDVFNKFKKDFEDMKEQINDTGINVKKFDVKGDGETDDTKNLQMALDFAESMGGGDVIMPIGKFIISETLYIGNNVRLMGNGKETIIEGVGGGENINTSIIENKHYGGMAEFNGARNFEISNLAVNSENRLMQGIYTEEASKFKINNIWGLGKTKDHWLDINNSEDGYIEKIHVLHDGNSSIQIDSANGTGNDNIVLKDITVKNPNKIFMGGTVNYRDSAIHFHNNKAKNIIISNVKTENVGCVVYKDGNTEIENIIIENVFANEFAVPFIFLTDDNTIISQNVILRNWIIKSDECMRAIGVSVRIKDLTIENFNTTVNSETKDTPFSFSTNRNLKFKNLMMKGKYEGFEGDLFKYTSDKESAQKEIALAIDEARGEWKPKISRYTGNYIRQWGLWSINGYNATFHCRIELNNNSGLDSGTVSIENLPLNLFNENFRASGSVSYVDGVEITGGHSITPYLNPLGNNIIFYIGGTNQTLKNTDIKTEFKLEFTLNFVLPHERVGYND